MISIRHQLAINASISTVYEMLSIPECIGAWWDKQTLVHTEEGDVLEHDPGVPHGIVRLKIIDQVMNQKVEWQCISAHPKNSPASAWTGTHFVFDLTDTTTPASIIERSCSPDHKTALTTLNFSQTNYDDGSEYFAFNNHAWGRVLESLKQACESKPRK